MESIEQGGTPETTRRNREIAPFCCGLIRADRDLAGPLFRNERLAQTMSVKSHHVKGSLRVQPNLFWPSSASQRVAVHFPACVGTTPQKPALVRWSVDALIPAPPPPMGKDSNSKYQHTWEVHFLLKFGLAGSMSNGAVDQKGLSAFAVVFCQENRMVKTSEASISELFWKQTPVIDSL